MIEENKQDAEQTKAEESQEKAPVKKSGMIKYLIFGVIGIVVVAGISLGLIMFLGDDKATEPLSKEEHVTDTKTDAHEDERVSETEEAIDDFDEESLLAELEADQSVIENIMTNLEFLDYVPDEAELGEDEEGISVEDSIETVNWLEQEKATLAAREKTVTAREKELETLNREISKKIVRLDQAESSRIAQLARLYDGMESRAVARLAANLDDETVVSILPRMKPKNASALLSLLPAKRAAKLSKQMITIAEN